MKLLLKYLILLGLLLGGYFTFVAVFVSLSQELQDKILIGSVGSFGCWGLSMFVWVIIVTRKTKTSLQKKSEGSAMKGLWIALWIIWIGLFGALLPHLSPYLSDYSLEVKVYGGIIGMVIWIVLPFLMFYVWYSLRIQSVRYHKRDFR